MIIKKLNIVSFGGLKNKEIVLDENFNIFYGLNESGKSTICAFLEAMLYGMNKPLKSESHIDIRAKYLPWDGERASGTMEFSFDGKDYILERIFGKTKRSDKCILRYADTFSECNEIDAENLGLSLLGLNEESYVKTMYMGQLKTFISGKDDEILKRLSNLSETGNEDASFSSINKILDDAKFSIIPKVNAKSIMRDLNEKKAELLFEKEKIELANNNLLESYKENLVLQDKINKLNSEVNSLKEEKENARKYEKFIANKTVKGNIEKLTKRKEDNESKLKEVNIKIKDIEDFLSQNDTDMLSEMALKLSELEDKKKETEIYKTELIKKENELNKLSDDDFTEKNKKISLVVIFLVLALLLFFAGGLLYNFELPLYIIFDAFMLVRFSYIFAFGLAVFFAVLSIVNIVKLIKSKSINKEKNIKKAELLKQIEELKALADNDSISKEINDALAMSGVADFREVKTRLSTLNDKKNEISLLKKEAQIFINNIKETKEDIVLNQNMLTDAEECEKTRTFEEIEREFNEKIARLCDAEKRKKEIEFKTSHETKGLRTLDVVETELSKVIDDISYYTDIHASLEIAKSVMAECEEELKSGFTPELMKNLSGIISELSKGKYSDVRLSDDYFAKVIEPKKSMIVDSDNLSGGTFDIIYIAVRIAILQSIFPEKIPFLIMDDTFLQLDDERIKTAIDFIKNILKTNQTFYFTCHRDIFDRFGENINKIIL